MSSLEVEFQYLSSRSDDASFEITDRMMDFMWTSMSMYPAGYYTRRIPIEASIRLPDGWSYATALETASKDAGWVRFKPVTFDGLVRMMVDADLERHRARA